MMLRCKRKNHLQALLNRVLSELQEEIVQLQQSYSSPPAKDYAEYRERVGKEAGLQLAVVLIGEAFKKWVNDDGSLED